MARTIETVRTAGRTTAAYMLVVAMWEAQEVIDFAKANKNAMAYFKPVEHRAKLSGLFIGRVEVGTVDLKGALEEARTRVLTAVDIAPGHGHGFVAAHRRIGAV